MKIDVTFQQTDMSFNTRLDNVIQMGEGGTGNPGATFFPSVSDEGVLSWINNGNLPNPEPVNIKGEAGYTPVKGMDYWTEADRTQMVADVISALPVYNGEVVE